MEPSRLIGRTMYADDHGGGYVGRLEDSTPLRDPLTITGEDDYLGRIRRDVHAHLPTIVIRKRLCDEASRYWVGTRRFRRWSGTAFAPDCVIIHVRLSILGSRHGSGKLSTRAHPIINRWPEMSPTAPPGPTAAELRGLRVSIGLTMGPGLVRNFTDRGNEAADQLPTTALKPKTWSGGPGEFHPRAPTDPGVTVSRHRALLTGLQAQERTTRQWANSPGARWSSPVHHRLNRLMVRSRLYFLPAQRLV